jgi:glycosyltransferase involved in cell wall biosynthesis
MFVGILFFHDDVSMIAHVVSFASIAGFMLITLLHIVFDQGKFILRNLIDLFDLFSPVGNETERVLYKKRILIFNWRDISHVHAGGAEVYIHELAKRWVADGYKVTLFCGNDGKCARYEEVDGVEVVRRGGFYFVYIWAFLYYIFKFRGKYDVIIDCENGIPFFTPLYTRERQYLVIHHVHQDVFSKSLIPPLSTLANYLESTLMPYVYDNVKIITVSPSSKEEIISSGIGKGEIDIVYNGVDLDFYVPTKKNERPIVLYLGRLKSYKSVDVFLKSAQQVLKKVPNAVFKIAGDGDQRNRLEQLAESLGITQSVEFLGKVSDQTKLALYQEAWVFVNPSYREGWGITTIEANACGTPVVASRVSGLVDSVRNPHTGYLVTYGDVEEFADKITMLLQDDSVRRSMSIEARKWSEEFSWQKSAQKGLEVLFV